MKDTFNCRNTGTCTQDMDEVWNFEYSSKDKQATDRSKVSKGNVPGKEKCIDRAMK